METNDGNRLVVPEAPTAQKRRRGPGRPKKVRFNGLNSLTILSIEKAINEKVDKVKAAIRELKEIL